MYAVSTNHEIFNGEKTDKEELITILSKLDAIELIITISLLMNQSKYETYFKEMYLSGKPYDSKTIEDFRKTLLYSKQGLLLLTKWVISYASIDKSFSEFRANPIDSINEVINLQLKVSDYLPTDDFDSVIEYLHKNCSLNTTRNIKNDIARAYYMFCKLSKYKNEFNEAEYMDINEIYSSKLNHSIFEFITLIFPLLDNHISKMIPVIDLQYYNNNCNNKNQLNEIVEGLSTGFQECRSWCIKTIDNCWDYSYFYKKPLIALNQNTYVSVHHDFLINQFFEGIYIRIVDNSYNSKLARTFMGRLFEKYIEKLTQNAIREAKNPKIHFIKEFKYGKDHKDSSDAYIRCGKTLIIIEAKGKRPLFSTYFKEDEKQLFKDVDKLVIEPIIQASKAYTNILDSNKSKIFDGIANVYILSVSFLSLPRITEVYSYVHSNVYGNLHPSVCGYVNMNIEEYEYFCGLISKKIDVVSLLEKFIKSGMISPFINFVNQFEYSSNMNTDWVSFNYKEFTNKAVKYYYK